MAEPLVYFVTAIFKNRTLTHLYWLKLNSLLRNLSLWIVIISPLCRLSEVEKLLWKAVFNNCGYCSRMNTKDTKVTEGGLNVTLTIRLLMHGKVTCLLYKYQKGARDSYGTMVCQWCIFSEVCIFNLIHTDWNSAAEHSNSS